MKFWENLSRDVLSGKIIAQQDHFCSEVTLGIENPDLRKRWFVIGQSKKAHLSARLHWPDSHRRLGSVRCQLSGEVRCYTLSALKRTAKAYIHKNYLPGVEISAVQCSAYIYSEQIGPWGVTHMHTRIHHCYINQCSMILRRETNLNLKLKLCR